MNGAGLAHVDERLESPLAWSRTWPRSETRVIHARGFEPSRATYFCVRNGTGRRNLLADAGRCPHTYERGRTVAHLHIRPSRASPRAPQRKGSRPKGV